MRKLLFLILIFTLLQSCRIVDFTMDEKKANKEFCETTLYVLQGFNKTFSEYYYTPYIFFNDGTFYAYNGYRFSKNMFTQKRMESIHNKGFYKRTLYSRWGIYTYENDSTIISEAITNTAYQTGPPIISFLPLFDTFYVEKFVFRNDTTLHRYLKKDKLWELQDTLYLNKKVDVTFIDPSKAWIYKSMLPYPYWKKKKK